MASTPAACKRLGEIMDISLHYKLIIFTLSLGLHNALNICTDVGNVGHLQEKTRLENSVFLTINATELMGCARHCLLRRRCTSFNFDLDRGACQLNEESTTGHFVGVLKTVFSEIDTWPERLAGNCKNHVCPNNTVCQLHDNGTTFCEVECSDPPSVANGTVETLSSLLSTSVSLYSCKWSVGTVLNYTCNHGYLATGNLECRPNGTWTRVACLRICADPPGINNSNLTNLTSGPWLQGAVLDYRCKPGYRKINKTPYQCLDNGTWSYARCWRIRTCTHIKICNSSYTDGEYWVYPRIFNKTLVKIYCRNMSVKPAHFITLLGENSVDYSNTTCEVQNGQDQFRTCSSTRFWKLRVNIATMESDRDDLFDKTFTNGSTCDQSGLALVFDCSTLCVYSLNRTFGIDTNGTGLIVDPGQTWQADNGTVHVERSPDNRVVTGTCQSGCGWCFPSYYSGVRSLKFVSDSKQNPPLDSAIMPSCE